jgi:DNA-binding CsgD family transcriptional regulator
VTPPLLWTDASALTLAAQFAARARHDSLALGVGVITRYFDGVRLLRPASLSSRVRSQLYASAAEYCCALGWTPVAARFAAEALLFADTGALRYRALSVSAFAQAMNGEFRVAGDHVARAHEIFDTEGWPVTDIARTHCKAEIVVASSRADVARLREMSVRMTAAQPDDPFWGFTARFADVLARSYARDFAGALAGSSELLYGSRWLSSPRPSRLFLLSVRSDMLVARGEYEEALAFLAPFENPEAHGICFESQRATSLIHLGRERQAIADTDACAADEAAHSLRTLVPLLARRAVAFQRMGSFRRAEQSMESVIMLLDRAGASGLPFLMLPDDEVRGLIDTVSAHRPELRATAEEVRRLLERVTAPTGVTPTPLSTGGLTPAERTLATMLVSPLTPADIARERGVSLNTVKSQLRSIYVKLGAAGRAEAVELLTRPVSDSR